ncbi:cobalamin biosynthesis protein [Chloroflexota bacterium]
MFNGLEFILVLLLAVVIDLMLGEPPRPVHPVVWMGKLASFLEKRCAAKRHVSQFIYGLAMTLFLVGLFAAASYFILYFLESFSYVAYVVIGAVLLKSTFSFRELRRAALKVKNLLVAGKLPEARYELRSLVRRDTSDLPEPLVISAAVESVAESTTDSFVAPLFYFILLGVPGAMAYRVVNTLDSMIGYHGEYEYLGKFAGKLDDVLNCIPARLAALLLVLSSFLSGRGVRASWRVALSEHVKTESPNAGWTMAAVAGALNVQLEKVGHYKLGKAGTPLFPGTIGASLQLIQITGLIWVVICFMVGGIRFVLAS